MSKPIVKQSALLKYLRLDELIAKATEALKFVEDQQEVIRQEITKLLFEGARIEKGACNALLKTVTGPRRPPWKDVYITHMIEEHHTRGDDEEATVFSQYPGKEKQVLVVSKSTE